jgi:hypothetical protein
MFFQWHCSCVLAPALRERITFGAGRAGIEAEDYGEECLGPLSIADRNFADGFLGVIEVMSTSSRSVGLSRRYRVVLVYSGDKWLIYPATPAVETMS